MSAYVIADIDVQDPVRYDHYRKMVPASIAAYGGRFLARGGRVESLEGPWEPKRTVIVEFPSVERAKAWWESAEYAPAKALRRSASQGSLILLEGL